MHVLRLPSIRRRLIHDAPADAQNGFSRVVHVLATEGDIDIAELAKRANVSEATARRAAEAYRSVLAAQAVTQDTRNAKASSEHDDDQNARPTRSSATSTDEGEGGIERAFQRTGAASGPPFLLHPIAARYSTDRSATTIEISTAQESNERAAMTRLVYGYAVGWTYWPYRSVWFFQPGAVRPRGRSL
jgi:hypothetical protein